MKKLIILLSALIIFGFELQAQTLSTVDFTDTNGNLPTVGSTFNVPVNVTRIGDVLGVTIFLDFDPNVLSIESLANQVFPNTTLIINTPGTAKVTVNGQNFLEVINIADGKLFDIVFKYHGGNSYLKFRTTSYDNAKSYIFYEGGTQYYFTDDDVTNGVVEGGYFENTIMGGDWDDPDNWSLGVVPTEWHNVTVIAPLKSLGSLVLVPIGGSCNNLTLVPPCSLTLSGGTLYIGGDFIVSSNGSGDASFIQTGGTLNVAGKSYVERFSNSGQWHSICAPLANATFAATYFNGNPNIWVSQFNETSNSYQYLTNPNAPMGDMIGYMTWIAAAAAPQIFTFEGNFRYGTVGKNNNLTNNTSGHNFVGNPFSSAIDWDASLGWTKTNIYNAIYVMNNYTWASYVNGVGVNGGSRYIAMGQGFFVQVNPSSPLGTLKMNNKVCVHNNVSFLKNDKSEQEVIRLVLSDNGNNDETVIRFSDEATEDFDGDLDAIKMFSFDEDYPQLYSVSNGKEMSINSLPFSSAVSIPLEIKGKDGDVMTITATETANYEVVNLKDNYTGTIANLKEGSYNFTYLSAVSDRFELFFNITGIEDNSTSNDVRIFSTNNNVRVVLDNIQKADITIYNLLGQVIENRSTNSAVTNIPVKKSGYYLVKVDDGSNVTTQKVFIK
jgi:hypothetical protein